MIQYIKKKKSSSPTLYSIKTCYFKLVSIMRYYSVCFWVSYIPGGFDAILQYDFTSSEVFNELLTMRIL